MDEKTLSYLNKDLLEKVNLILAQSKQFLRVTRQKKLTPEILLNSIKLLRFKDSLISKDELFLLENDENNNNEYISIDEYLKEPIIKKPLDTIVYYHWFSIRGQSPKTSVNKLDNKKISLINTNLSKNDLNLINSKIVKDNHDLITKTSKNISKELAHFVINFEKIFQDIITQEFINFNQHKEFNFLIQQDLDINANIIKYEPEIVQIFPYLITFLEEKIKNKEIIKMPRMQYIILYHLKCICYNKYFDLLAYLNIILQLIMMLLLYSNNSSNDELINTYIKVKDNINQFLKELIVLFPKFIPDLILSLSNYILPLNKDKKNLLKSLSVFKCINLFGYEYIVKYLYPKIIQIKKIFEEPTVFKYKNKIIFCEKNSNNNSQNQNSFISNQSQSQSSIPLKTFTIPFSNEIGMPFSVSNIGGESFVQSFLQSNNNNINYVGSGEKISFRVSNNVSEEENLCKENIITYFYIEIFKSIELVLKGMKERKIEQETFDKVKNELIIIFGEGIFNLLNQ